MEEELQKTNQIVLFSIKKLYIKCFFDKVLLCEDCLSINKELIAGVYLTPLYCNPGRGISADKIDHPIGSSRMEWFPLCETCLRQRQGSGHGKPIIGINRVIHTTELLGPRSTQTEFMLETFTPE